MLAASDASGTLRRESASTEAALIERALRSAGGNATVAARLLGINRTTLWRKQVRYGLRPGVPANRRG